MSELVLVFERDNPCNTTISHRDTGEIYYTVKTEHTGHSYTRVKNGDDQEIASWQWRNMRSDLLTLNNGPPSPASAWLKKSLVPFKNTVYFSDHLKRRYKWKGNAPGLQLELFSELDKTHPIAQFKKSIRRKDTSQTPPVDVLDPATLTIDSRGQDIMDMIVIAFCLLEKDRRADETSTVNRADAIAVSGGGAGGGGGM
ncbi:hypothetical protein FA15DRAFT_673297 [Coprinopsis marcescibilis]|uniref:DUF6593 domain-containing protein n=1 Tax=Coprinopsis marcescibilis TaxID=230819 RepID=A0A5C3KKD5_COPMA|nr:hypothetical protein FA15DRAFT_673297 [Coprinopsis marcescibilis]